MKRDKSFAWNRVDTSALDLKGIKVAIVGGTGGIGRAFGRFMASCGSSMVVVGLRPRSAHLSAEHKKHASADLANACLILLPRTESNWGPGGRQESHRP
jgi:NAD(P)-dependent dehydrogenase (short-subunit alcohol dehydrogenase family)